MENSQKLVRIGEVARVLGLSPSRVRQLADEGAIPFSRSTGGHRLFDIGAIRQAQAVRELPRSRKERPLEPPAWHTIVSLAGADEATVWAQLRDDLDLEDASARRIMQYAFTEMLNNAIDHSGSKTASVTWWTGSALWAFEIADDGDGIFPHVRDGLGLDDLFAAIQELTKGRTTTDPRRHTGEGIFFTSKMVDLFTIESAGLAWTVDNLRDDQAVGVSKTKSGTRVLCELDPKTRRQTADVFARFSDEDNEFSRSHTVVRLFRLGVRFVSRSEAKRLLHGMERFREVEIDFDGVDEVGQGFVDELVRVWPSEHQDTVITPVRMNAAVDFMVRRGLSRIEER
jgi:excisionase family DNA binding protein